MSSAGTDDVDLFTPVFKYFRRLPDVDCFSEAFSVARHPFAFQRCPTAIPDELDPSLGLEPISTWSLYSCQFCPGLFLLTNPFTAEGQRQWINRCVNTYARQARTSVGDNSDNQHLTRLRWSTLGYHYDWTNKVYRPEDRTPMPDELLHLCQIVMKFISLNTGCATMQAEAAIVNYYHLNSTLCAHTDHSEYDALTKPLLSFSFGNAGIFLVGGETKSVCKPSPILLRSGDIILMTGGSRLCFHAVPRILRDPLLATIFDEHTATDRDAASWSYIHDKRVNINIRQVYASANET